MMHRNAFDKFGPFDPFPQMLAETRLAERVLINGTLRLITAEIFTSARRFESEGMFVRQLLNVFLLNCADQGWYEPFHTVSGIYRNHGDTERLSVCRTLKTINRLILDLPPNDRRNFLRSTGRYACRNGWQIPFFIDVMRNFIKGCDPGKGTTPLLDLYDRFISPIPARGSCGPG